MISREQVNQLLQHAVKNQASDIHLCQGYPPIVRIDGKLQALKGKVLSKQDMEDILVQIMDDFQMERFKKDLELDFGYEIPDVAHFRVNAFTKLGGYAMAYRIIPDRIRTLQELGMPPGVINLAEHMEGLILVTGPTGHGKSTTLAAIIDKINEERNCHIITIEDPIEYTHKRRNSLVQQRELGHHTHSFAASLRSALREDPDVILVGEMRDLETISLALTAAETGHLVLSTLHTRNAPDTVNRIIDVFPPAQQQQIRLQLSTTLQAVITETLVRRKGAPGRAAAFEIMVCTPAIRSAIREAKTPQIYTSIQTGSRLGMIQMDQYLWNLFNQGVVDYEEALAHCNNPDEFEKKAKR